MSKKNIPMKFISELQILCYLDNINYNKDEFEMFYKFLLNLGCEPSGRETLCSSTKSKQKYYLKIPLGIDYNFIIKHNIPKGVKLVFQS